MLRPLGASAAVFLALALAACAGPTSPSAETPTPSASAEVRSVVVIGDSIPYNSSDYCPGCTSFPDSMATALSDAEGVRYEAINRSRYDGAQTADILEQVESGELDEELSKAAIIVVSSGFNDQPPYWEAGEPCSSGPVDSDDDARAGPRCSGARRRRSPPLKPQ